MFQQDHHTHNCRTSQITQQIDSCPHAFFTPIQLQVSTYEIQKNKIGYIVSIWIKWSLPQIAKIQIQNC